MLIHEFPHIITAKREFSAKPLVHYDGECILIAGEAGFAAQLLRRHIKWCTCCVLCPKLF